MEGFVSSQVWALSVRRGSGLNVYVVFSTGAQGRGAAADHSRLDLSAEQGKGNCSVSEVTELRFLAGEGLSDASWV